MMPKNRGNWPNSLNSGDFLRETQVTRNSYVFGLAANSPARALFNIAPHSADPYVTQCYSALKLATAPIRQGQAASGRNG
jgi:hypothetical protein